MRIFHLPSAICPIGSARSRRRPFVADTTGVCTGAAGGRTEQQGGGRQRRAAHFAVRRCALTTVRPLVAERGFGHELARDRIAVPPEPVGLLAKFGFFVSHGFQLVQLSQQLFRRVGVSQVLVEF